MHLLQQKGLTVRKFVYFFMRKYRWQFVLLSICVLMWPINEALFPWFIKHLINNLYEFPTSESQSIWPVVAFPVLGIVILWGIAEIAMRVQGILDLKLFPKLRADIRLYIFNYVKDHSPQFFADHFAGNIAKKIDQLPDSCYKIIDIVLINFLSIFVAAALSLFLLWQVNAFFMWILLVWLILYLAITIGFGPSCHHYAEAHADSKAQLGGKIVDVLGNIRTVHAYARGHYEFKYLQPFQNDEIQKAQRTLWQLEFMQICLSVINFIMIGGMVLSLIYLWRLGLITLGDFMLISTLSLTLVSYMWFVTKIIDDFYMHIGTVHSSIQLIARKHDIKDNPKAQPLQFASGSIRFDQVTFHYGNNIVFDKLDLYIPAQQKIGLVGFSGAGKSTLVNILMRHFDISEGTISIDGQNITEVTQDSLHDAIAMIPQDPSLFHRSLLENIRYGRLDATDEEVMEAANLAHCDKFIADLPEHYNTLVGERGVKLSGGQRQRIAIARAFIKNSPIVILDEATSSLDSLTEHYIQDSLKQLMRQRTCIVIAHRLSTLADMDRIIVLEKGKIIEDGSIDELLKLDGQFAQLWHMQKGGLLPE